MGIKYKLIAYTEDRFNVLPRTILAYVGQDFEDVRIPRAEAQDIEKDIPFGTLPVLKEKGKVVAIQGEISRYLAKKHGLAGKSPEEEAKCNIVMEGLRKLLLPLIYSIKDKTEEEKLEAGKKYFSERGMAYLIHFDKLLKEHEDLEYFVSNEITYCDLAVASICGLLVSRHPSLLDPCPALKAFFEKMKDLPVIKELLAKMAEIAKA